MAAKVGRGIPQRMPHNGQCDVLMSSRFVPCGPAGLAVPWGLRAGSWQGRRGQGGGAGVGQHVTRIARLGHEIREEKEPQKVDSQGRGEEATQFPRQRRRSGRSYDGSSRHAHDAGPSRQ